MTISLSSAIWFVTKLQYSHIRVLSVLHFQFSARIWISIIAENVFLRIYIVLFLLALPLRFSFPNKIFFTWNEISTERESVEARFTKTTYFSLPLIFDDLHRNGTSRIIRLWLPRIVQFVNFVPFSFFLRNHVISKKKKFFFTIITRYVTSYYFSFALHQI